VDPVPEGVALNKKRSPFARAICEALCVSTVLLASAALAADHGGLSFVPQTGVPLSDGIVSDMSYYTDFNAHGDVPGSVFLCSASISAQEEWSDVYRRLAELEAECELLRSTTLERSEVPSLDHGEGADRHDCWCWEAGVELVSMKIRLEDGVEEYGHGEHFEYDLASSPRIWLSASHPKGLGLRARYWEYRDSSTVTRLDPIWTNQRLGQMFIDAYTIDLEFFQEFVFGDWRCGIAAGARNAWLAQEIRGINGPDFMGKTFHAAGPLLSLDVRRSLMSSGLEILAIARGDLLVGQSKWANVAGERWTDDTGATFEMQLGMQYRRCVGCWGEVFVRGVWEQQMWLGAGTFMRNRGSPTGATLDMRMDDHDVAFMGFAFSIGFKW